jgi:4-hydroxybenzoate polyprenyltransferase
MFIDVPNAVLKKITAILTLLRVYTTPFYVPAVISGFILAGNLNIIDIVLFNITVLLILFLTNTLNFYYDAKADTMQPMAYAENPFSRHILTSKEATIISIFFIITPISISVIMGTFWIPGIVIGLFLGIIYNVKPFRLKAKPYGWFVDAALSPALAFLFAYIVASFSVIFPVHVMLTAIFFYLAFIPMICKDIPDMKADASINDRTFPIVYGVKVTQIVAVGSIALAFLFFLLLTLLGIVSYVGLPLSMLSMTLVSRLILQQAKLKDRQYVYVKICIAGVSSFFLIFLFSLALKTIYNW